MILAHHGFGEELVLYAAAGGGTTVVSTLALLGRARLARIVTWLRRR